MGRYGGECSCICQTDCVPTFSRPDGDVRVRSNWHTKPGGQSVYRQIDEVTHDDGTTYAYGDPSLAMGNYFIVDMSNLSYLNVYWYDHVRWWQRAPGAGRITVTATVQHDATDIQSFTYESYVNEFWGQADFVVPIDVARNIADAENLKLKFEITSGSSGDYAQITQAEYERRCQDGCSDGANGTQRCVTVTVTGTGTTHDWACCSNQFPDNLTATISNVDGCDCADGKTVTMRKIGSQYVGSGDFGCRTDGVHRVTMSLECVAEGINDWKLTVRFDNGCNSTHVQCYDSGTCSPISLVFSNVCVDFCCGPVTSCCTGVSLPRTLTATVEATSSSPITGKACKCIDGDTFTLNYDDESGTWTGTHTTAGCGFTPWVLNYTMQCDPSTGNFEISYTSDECSGFPTASIGGTISCDPLEISFIGFGVTICCETLTAGTWKITVTE